MTVKIAGSLPKGDENGVGATNLLAELIHHPMRVHVAVVLFDTAKITRNIDTGDVIPTIAIRAIEAVPADTAEAVRLRTMLRDAYEQRTGKFELPFELEHCLTGAGGIEPSDGSR